jgi:hypothetical protein
MLAYDSRAAAARWACCVDIREPTGFASAAAWVGYVGSSHESEPWQQPNHQANRERRQELVGFVSLGLLAATVF